MLGTTLITGGSGHIGSTIVRDLVRRQIDVIFTSTSNERAKALSVELENPPNLSYVICDFLEPGGIEALVNRITSRGKQVNHLINNARSKKTLHQDASFVASRSDFLGEYEMNVVSAYELAVTLLDAQPGKLKTVVNIGSKYGSVAVNPKLYDGGNESMYSPVHYGVSKAALHHLTRELAVRFAARDVRVNAISLGGVEGSQSGEFLSRYAEMSPLGRMLKPSEILGPIDFLLSETSSGVTGQVLAVDGGWTIW